MVHGFSGHLVGTWTDEASDKCWARDHVPNEMKPHIRVLTFRYYESRSRPYQRESLSGYAQDLLGHLLKDPQRRVDKFRSVVWVAHSAGGIVVKQVCRETSLTCSSLECSKLFLLPGPHNSIALSTPSEHFLLYSRCGTLPGSPLITSTISPSRSSFRHQIFFATPHHSGGSWDRVVAEIFDQTPCFQFYKVTSTSSRTRQLLDDSAEDTTGLDSISNEFALLSNDVMGFFLVSFEEERPMVSRHSSPWWMDGWIFEQALNPPQVEGRDPHNLKIRTKRTLFRGHFNICKPAKGDPDLAHVWDVIEQMGSQPPASRRKRVERSL